jgi:hypothetical protein
MNTEPLVTISLTEYERLKRIEGMKMASILAVGYKYEIKEDDNPSMLWGCKSHADNIYHFISQWGTEQKHLTIQLKINQQ